MPETPADPDRELPRFPFVALGHSVGCISAAAWAWALYSHTVDVTPDDALHLAMNGSWRYVSLRGDVVVRIAAIVTLSQWGDEESRPAIEEAAQSKSFRLRRCAELALKRLGRAAEAKENARGSDVPPAKSPVVREKEPQF